MFNSLNNSVYYTVHILKSARNEAEQEDIEDSLPHGTTVLKKLVLPWAKGDKIVCADSYFSSVPAAEELWKHGIRFIDVIKTGNAEN